MEEFMPTFTFKEFALTDRRCGLKIGTDGVLLGAWAECPRLDGHVADIGAGCGVVGMMIASRYPMARVVGVETDAGAVADFAENLVHFPGAGRVRAMHGSFTALQGSFDLIVSNPPFFVGGAVAPDAARAGARHAGELSPLSLPAFAASRLAPDGRLAMIAPVEMASDILMEASLARLEPRRIVEVATSARRGVTRTLWEFCRKGAAAAPAETGRIAVGDETYKALTRRFYLHY